MYIIISKSLVFNFGTTWDILGSCPLHCEKKKFSDITKCPLGNKSQPIENHIPKAITKINANERKTEVKWNHKKYSTQRKEEEEKRTEETKRKQ